MSTTLLEVRALCVFFQRWLMIFTIKLADNYSLLIPSDSDTSVRLYGQRQPLQDVRL